MNLGMFDRFCPSLKARAQLEEKVDLINLIEIEKDMLFLCIERIFGLMNGCRNLERIFADCRSNTVILVRSTGEVGELTRERED
jgi:hypothetical protein